MKRRIIIVVVIVIAAVAVTGVYAGWFSRDASLQGSGTVEARNIRVGSKIGGRILQVLVREGDRVQPGQTLITFDDKELQASMEQARANAQKSQRGYRPEEIQEAQAAAAQAKADYEMHLKGYRKEDIAAAQADVDRATADESRAHLDFQRYEALAEKDLVSKQQRDTTEANWKMARAAKENAQHKLDELQRGFRPEEIAMAEAKYQQAQATLEKLQHGNRREDVDSAKAELAYEEARYRERQVLAPSSATVEVLDVRPGDLIAPNTPIATLLESDQIYVRIYVPETELNKVAVGQKAQIRVDPFQKQTFDGVVEQINQQAEFLPRNVQTREERVHQVFGVKVRIDDPSHRVLPGMAADVKLLP
ncbi:MAG TPA: HlyD family efflux transporter periplasmic adaptor subunit [Candidatus Dormibacteraeota bacterium]|jgi:HlyD family secretion protein|nr:HlyD family efflux transporter periplasmic adaptor subunit [Candidatus Dormibacteraeota bacterium]